MTPFLVAVVLLIIAYELYKFYTDKPANVPPCMPRLPIVGSYWHLLWGNYQFPHKTVAYYVDKLKSKLISCYFGPNLTIIANDYKSVKEILAREEFDGRLADVYVLQARAFGQKLGIFFIDGPQWKEQRRFTLRHMRDFGFGRRQEQHESEIMDEISVLINTLKNGPINDEEKTILRDDQALFPDILYAFGANSIWLIMFGERFDRPEHHKLRYLCRSAMLFQRTADTTGGAISIYPFLRYFGNMFGYKNIMKANYAVVDFIKEYLAEHKRTHHENSDRGMIDRYIEELKKSEEPSTFSEKQLIMALVDIMFPAFSALPSVVVHCIKYSMHHPEVLRKVQEEIDSVIGVGRYITWDDRKNLPYTEATIRETMRYETLTPLSVIHKCMKDTTLFGYNIPKDTPVAVNLSGMHHDRDFWGDPECYRPERFLSEEGQLKKDFTMPFGFGHRVCAGETFARNNIFGLFSNLVQNFDFSFVEGQSTGLEDKLPGLIVTPKETWIRFKPRC